MDKKIIVNMQEEKEPLGDLFGIFFDGYTHLIQSCLSTHTACQRSEGAA